MTVSSQSRKLRGRQVDVLDDVGRGWGMTMGDLRSFTVVARLASFTEAARHCHVSQPGMSARILRLERELGTGLLDRATRPVSLTPSGKGFLPIAIAVVDELTLFRDAAVAVARPDRPWS
jgi:DNA-binding transcriptional LysR family regulator